MPHLSTMKPSFLNELCQLEPKEMAQITEKLKGLSKDPSPDGSTKKKLKYLDGRLNRLRAGHFRVIYTFDKTHVSLLALRRREKDTYDEDFDPEFLGGLDLELPQAVRATPAWEAPEPRKPPATKLPGPITDSLLKRLQVPAGLFRRLLSLTTEEQLFGCDGVGDDVKIRIHQALVETPIDQALRQPDLVVPDVSDLIRFREGDLLGFLLKLDPEQEALVTRNLAGTGPTLLKGGPGTGKSTVAIYRVREMLRTLPRGTKPRILFTTYTNALVAFTKQLLEQLLGTDAEAVDVRTADSLVKAIVAGDCKAGILDGHQAATAVAEAVETAELRGNALVQRAQREALKRLKAEYLRDEIGGVIEGRALASLDEYLAAPRPGRLVPLNAMQRRAVWAVRERLVDTLKANGQWTWERLRRRALRKVESGKDTRRFAAVVVDEAQDLDPTVLRLLTTLAAEPSRLFITADANQSIYGSGFSWKDVHESLRFQGGRSGTIRTNHRSTREIGEAAQAYLAGSVLEAPEDATRYEHSGALPALRRVATLEAEAALLARFLKEATREARLPTSSAAVLVPSEKTGRPLAHALSRAGVATEFMPGKDLDLRKPVVKAITIKSAKGLEFPVVAIAGFMGLPSDGSARGSAEEEDEVLRRERRANFVGMTRAMRALLVIAPEKTSSPLLQGFPEEYWNVR